MRYMKLVGIAAIFCILTNSAFSQLEEKLRIALLDFSTTGGLSRAETITLGNRLRSVLVKSNAFIVLERGKMEEILSEQGIQQIGCTTTECAVEVGKLLNVQKMVSGAIGKVGRTYTIDLSLIDVETAQIEKSFFQDYQGEIDGLLSIMEDISAKIAATAGQKPVTPPAEDKKIFRISVRSDPPGATLFINGQRAGDTPFSSRVREGLSLEITLRKDNYMDWSREITVTGDINIDQKLDYTDSYKQELARRARSQEQTTPGSESGTSAWWYIGGGAVLVGAAAVLLTSGGGDDAGGEDGTTDQGFPLPPTRP